MIRRFDSVLYWTGWVTAQLVYMLLDEIDRRRYSGWAGPDYRKPRT